MGSTHDRHAAHRQQARPGPHRRLAGLPAPRGQLTQITKDHSFVQQLVDEGRITEDEADGHPQRSLVTRVITGQHDDEPDVTVREARIGDRYLIASDGLTDYVPGDTIADGPRSGEPRGQADRLVALALKAGAPDNVTIVIGDVVDLTKVTARRPSHRSSAPLPPAPGGTRPSPSHPLPRPRPSPAKRPARARTTRPGRHARRGGPTSGRARWLRRLAVLGLAVIVLGGGAYAA